MSDYNLRDRFLLSLDIFDRLIKPAYRRFCKKARGMKILHMCGNASPFLETLSECGFEGCRSECYESGCYESKYWKIYSK